jgi:hypothetical protein
MTSANESSRSVVRLSRPNRRPLNPSAIGELLHEDLVGHDAACVELIVEVDESALELIESRGDYQMDVLSPE